MAIVSLASGALGLTSLVRDSATELATGTVKDPAGERVAQ
jgi:hypothetical protein